MPSHFDDTDPGLGNPPIAKLMRDNERLKSALAAALVSASERPPPTRKQRRAHLALNLGKYAALIPLVAIAGRAAAKRWPELTEIVDAVLALVGQ